MMEQLPKGPKLEQEIERLRKDRNAVILAHYYQEDEIQDIADFIGDSLELSRRAAEAEADVIVFAGVHFMAETAKILNPTRTVLIPDLEAGCSLADSCPDYMLRAWKNQHPDHYVISYINCTAGTKALSDIICTSSNAVKVVEQAPKDRPILFGPDRYLGDYVRKQTGRDLELWQGTCIVHERFSLKELLQLKVRHPQALTLAHPECPEPILKEADVVGSTSQLLKACQERDADEFIVATEPGIIHQMKKNGPGKSFIPLSSFEETCACNECPYMRLNTMEKLYLCLRDLQPEVTLPDQVIEEARKPIEAMLAIS